MAVLRVGARDAARWPLDHPIADDGGPAASWAGASLPGGQRLSLNPPIKSVEAGWIVQRASHQCGLGGWEPNHTHSGEGGAGGEPRRRRRGGGRPRATRSGGGGKPGAAARHAGSRLGLEQAADQLINLGGRPGGCPTGPQDLTVVHSLVAGGDCIDDVEALRAGASASVLGHRVMAASTVGTFLRAFTFGHVRQLDRLVETAR